MWPPFSLQSTPSEAQVLRLQKLRHLSQSQKISGQKGDRIRTDPDPRAAADQGRVGNHARQPRRQHPKTVQHLGR